MPSSEQVRDHIGDCSAANFEVLQATETEVVETEPQSVYFGRHRRGPLVKFEYNKYNSFLPPWDRLVSFTLVGDNTAEFGMPEHVETQITGTLKTVSVRALTCSLS